MEHHITVRFGDIQKFDFALSDADTVDVTWEQAQRWLDEEYVNTMYEAASPVGTTPLAEKLLRIVMAYGPQPFANNTAWAKKFVRCAGRAVGKINITLDITDPVAGL